jgi:thioredoxin-like negative regulator of GroEL
MSIDGLASDVVYRLLIAVGIAFIGLALYWAINTVTLARARARVTGLERARRGVPVLLYFTTPTCAPCKTIQRPAIQRLQERIGERLEVVEIDAASQPEVASRWGVLSVPTTFIIDAQGNPRYVNHGVAPLDKLQRQLSEIIS